MTYFTDLSEMKTDKPKGYYIADLERANRQLINHTQWIRYYNEKILILKKILKEKGVDMDAITKTNSTT